MSRSSMARNGAAYLYCKQERCERPSLTGVTANGLLKIVAIAIMLGLSLLSVLRAECDITTKCSDGCPNQPIVFSVVHDSVLYPGTRTHRFSVDFDAQGIDTAYNAGMYATVTCVAGGSASGRRVECSAGIYGGGYGCVSCDSSWYLDVGWCDPVVTFRLEIRSMNSNNIGVLCRCRYYCSVPIPSDFQPFANSGSPSCEAQIGDPVDAISGNLFLERSDVYIGSDRGLPIDFRRYYNSYSPDRSPDQKAMLRTSYSDRLYEGNRVYWKSDDPRDPMAVVGVTLVESSGKSIYFRGSGFVSDMTFYAVESPYRLEYVAADTAYVLTKPDGTRMEFACVDILESGMSYGLSKVTDRNGNELSLDWYLGDLTRIAADSNRFVNLVYESVFGTGEHYLSAITDTSSDTLVSYQYADTTGFLTRVDYADGSWEEYTPIIHYGDSNRIVQTLDSDSATWHWIYEGNYYVSETYNNVSPDVEHAQLIYSEYPEYDIDTIIDGIDTTIDSSVVRYWREVDARYNHDTTQVTTYVSYRYPDGWRWYLSEVIDNTCGGCGNHFTYNYNGVRTSAHYANGRWDYMVYDSEDNLDTLRQAWGTDEAVTVAFDYDTVYNLLTYMRLASVVNSSGYMEIFLNRDSAGNVTSVIETGWIDTTTSYADTVSYTYSSYGQVIKIDGPRTDVADSIGIRYDSTHGDLLYLLYPNGDTVEYGTRGAGIGGIPYIIDPNGVKTEFAYDERGRVQSVLQNALSADSARTDIELNFKGAIKQLTLPLGNAYSFDYDSNNWMTRLLTGSGDSIVYDYDDMSNVSGTKYYDSAGVLHKQETYVSNWKSQLTQTDGLEFRYDAMGQVDTVIAPALNDSTFLEYDLFGRITRVVDVADDGTHQSTWFDYDLHGNLIEVIDPDSNAFVYWYDDRGLLMRDSSSITGVRTYSYDVAGNLTGRTDAKGNSFEYEYDALNRLTGRHFSDSMLEVAYTYDGDSAFARGRLVREETEGSAIDYGYDAFGRLVSESQTVGDSTYGLTYGYNLNGQVTSVTYPSGVEYTYGRDSEGRVSRISARLGAGQSQVIADSITYVPFGGIKSIWYANGVITRYSYDSLYNLTGISTGSDGVLRRSYVYDSLGNVISYLDSLDSDNNTYYTYDNLHRLRSMVRASLPVDTVEYLYNANGNRQAEIIGSDTTEYGYTNNRLTSLSGATQAMFGYDNNGNLVSQVMGADTIAFGYDQLNRLASVTRNDTTFEETYNSRSQRQSLITPGGTGLYVYAANGLMLSEYYDDEWEADYIYLGGLQIARVWAYNEEVDTTTTTHFDISWYHNDHLGTPLVVTDTAKTIRWSAQYYPFGTLASENVSLLNNLRFPGQYHDRSTGLYYNMFRHYRPDLGRYTTPDPIGLAGGLNLYGYAGQNPVNYMDPNGLSWLSDFGVETAQLLVGFGDMVSLGATRSIRQMDWYGGDYFTDQSSFGYRTGGNAGLVVLTYLGFEAAPAALAGGAIILRGLQSAAAATYGLLISEQGGACSSGGSVSTLGVNERLWSVYVGFDKSGAIRYVGITSRRLLARAAEHFREIGTGKELLNYQLIQGATGLSWIQARIVEQTLMNLHGLGRLGGELLNHNNSIRPSLWWLHGIR